MDRILIITKYELHGVKKYYLEPDGIRLLQSLLRPTVVNNAEAKPHHNECQCPACEAERMLGAP